MNLEKGIIWLDIETTGIDPIDDKILEVCLIITDKDLKVLATKNVVINIEDSLLKKMPSRVVEMHTNTNLIEEVRKSSLKLKEAEIELIDFLSKYTKKGVCPMGGNSVHFDRGFLKNHMLQLHDWFHYRNLDVSSLIMVFNQWRKDVKIPRTDFIQHRAEGDILNAIRTLAYYKIFIQS